MNRANVHCLLKREEEAMTINGANVYLEGVNVDQKYDDKMQQIVNTIKSLSPSSEVSMRFLKNGNLYEGLLWGKAGDVPIAVYKSGRSMTRILDTFCDKLKKQSLKLKNFEGAAKFRPVTHFPHQKPMATAA